MNVMLVLIGAAAIFLLGYLTVVLLRGDKK